MMGTPKQPPSETSANGPARVPLRGDAHEESSTSTLQVARASKSGPFESGPAAPGASLLNSSTGRKALRFADEDP